MAAAAVDFFLAAPRFRVAAPLLAVARVLEAALFLDAPRALEAAFFFDPAFLRPEAFFDAAVRRPEDFFFDAARFRADTLRVPEGRLAAATVVSVDALSFIRGILRTPVSGNALRIIEIDGQFAISNSP